jgi:hypothetical protein
LVVESLKKTAYRKGCSGAKVAKEEAFDYNVEYDEFEEEVEADEADDEFYEIEDETIEQEEEYN